MTIVVDASLVVAALAVDDARGVWAEQVLSSDDPIAPQFLLVECTSVIRRSELRDDISPERAARAYEDLLALSLTLLPFHRFAQRVWQLRYNVTPYDAWYVAIAEAFDIPMATLDGNLVRAPGPRCRFLTP